MKVCASSKRKDGHAAELARAARAGRKRARVRKKKNLWPFDAFVKTTVRKVKTGATQKQAGSHRGLKIFKLGSGEFIVPGVDRESRLDSLRDAKRFIDANRSNPKRKPGKRKKPAVKKSAAIKKSAAKSRRGNPEGTAAERYEYFHGRAPDEVFEFETDVKMHSVLSGIGKLERLMVVPVNGSRVVELSGFRGAILSQDERGRQLYIAGGDQSVNLKDFGIAAPHESEVLGAVDLVEYRTQKDHLGKDGGKAVYSHKFGGRGSRLPMLIYDVRNKLLSFAGGGYTLPEVGIDG